MAIPDEDVAKVRAATDISALIGEHTSLKRVGTRYVGLCPFHGEKSPSFSVNAEEGLYYCFGCQASGDAITFVRAIEGCDFVEAVERLAGRAGITIRNDSDPATDAARGRRQKLYEALASAAEFYHRYLLESKDAGRARRYLRARGYDGEVARQFNLGFAPDGYDVLVRELNCSAQIMREGGLAYENSRGKMQDVMRERVIFPIFDPMGRVIALGGRVLPDELRKNQQNPGPKYRNSPESAIYSKSSTLYGLNWAKGEVAKAHEVIVCEGYTDVIGFATAGVPRAVATCGTALTEQHFRLLSRFAKKIVLSFDADNAGQNAAARLYEFERRHDVELAIAELPQGSDPGDLARKDPARLRDAVSSSLPFLGFRVDRALAEFDLSNPEGRSRAATAAIAAIAEHPSDLVRDQYIVNVADRTHNDPSRLRSMLEAERTLAAQRPPVTEAAPANFDERPLPNSPEEPQRAISRAHETTKESRPGRDGLMLAIHRPEEVASWIDESLFQDPIQRSALRALFNAEELHQAIDQAEPDAALLLRRLIVTDGAETIDAEGTLIELVRAATIRALAEVDVEARLKSNDPDALSKASAMSKLLKEELELLRDPIEREGAPTEAVAATHRLLMLIRQPDSVKESSETVE